MKPFHWKVSIVVIQLGTKRQYEAVSNVVRSVVAQVLESESRSVERQARGHGLADSLCMAVRLEPELHQWSRNGPYRSAGAN